MNRKLTFILLGTMGGSLLVSTVLIALLVSRSDDGYQHNCDMSGIAYGITWFMILVMTMANSTIYLNNYPKIRQHKLRFALSFFLAPVLVTLAFSLLLGYTAEEGQLYAAAALPYGCILTWHYLRFNKSKANNV